MLYQLQSHLPRFNRENYFGKKLQFFSFLILIFFLIGNLYSQSGWVQQISSTTNKINSICFLDVNTGFACTDGGLLLKTTNSGVNWNVFNTGFTLSLKSVRFFNSLIGIIASEKLLRTTNGGISWYMARDSVYGYYIYKLNFSVGYLAGDNIGPKINNLKTTNAGESWIEMAQVSLGHKAVHFINENTGYVAWIQYTAGTWGSYGISKTTNGGINWTNQFSEMSYHAVCNIYDLFFPSINTGFAIGYNQAVYKLFKTYSGGTNWMVDTVSEFYGIYFANDFTGWVCGANGVVKKTTNSGQSWFNSPTQISNNLNSIYFVDNNTGWVAGNGGIILKTTNGGILTVEPISSEIPKSYSLSQNYPNPFNPSTKIRFSVPSGKFEIPNQSKVKIIVYDLLGREITRLVNEQLKPGTYEVEFDGSNFASGVYYYTLQTESFKETKRMVLIK
jgi:photosystem II stability/assembly factor-like uncharacterized protein